jgi:hypothetical protein
MDRMGRILFSNLGKEEFLSKMESGNLLLILHP